MQKHLAYLLWTIISIILFVCVRSSHPWTCTDRFLFFVFFSLFFPLERVNERINLQIQFNQNHLIPWFRVVFATMKQPNRTPLSLNRWSVCMLVLKRGFSPFFTRKSKAKRNYHSDDEDGEDERLSTNVFYCLWTALLAVSIASAIRSFSCIFWYSRLLPYFVIRRKNVHKEPTDGGGWLSIKRRKSETEKKTIGISRWLRAIQSNVLYWLNWTRFIAYRSGIPQIIEFVVRNI